MSTIRRKSAVLIIAAAGMAGCGAYAATWWVLTSGPQLDAPAEIDLGACEPTKVVIVDCPIRNGGTAPLELWDFQSTCDCLLLEHRVAESSRPVDRISLAPGETAVLVPRLRIQGESGTMHRSRILFATSHYLLSPSTMTIPRRSGTGLVFEARTVCRKQDGKRFRLAVDSVPHGLNVTILPGEDGTAANVVIQWDRAQLLIDGPQTTTVTLCARSDTGAATLSMPITLFPPE